MALEAPRRHDLVRIDPGIWAGMLSERSDLAGVPHLADWAERGRPLIVRRYGPGEANSLVPLGLPLPPANGKRRIGFAACSGDLVPVSAPPLLQACASAPAAWIPTLEALLALSARHGLVPRPFGALLWQVLTGLDYLTLSSDLDLLWPLSGAAPPPGFLDGLAAIAADAPMRIDGEVLLPDGAGIHWRELHEASEDSTILAKHLDRLELRSVANLYRRAA